MPPTEKIPPPVSDMIIALNNKIIALQANPAAKLEAPKNGPPPPPALSFEPVVRGKAPRRRYPADMVRKGAVIVMAGSCNDCHTPWVNDPVGRPAPDLSRMLSGHPQGAPDPQGKPGQEDIGLIGPTFTSFAAAFRRRVLEEPHAGRRDRDRKAGPRSSSSRSSARPATRTGALLPPMPWTCSGPSDADLRAVFAYLQSIPPIRNEVPDSRVPPPVMEAIERANEILVKRSL